MTAEPNAREERLLTDLNRASAIEVLLRGQLWIEQELIAALDDLLPFPKHLDSPGQPLSYSQRVRLVAAHGLIREEDLSGYNALNRLRNHVAHRADFELGPGDVRDLVNALGGHTRNLFNAAPALGESDASDDGWLDELRFAIVALFTALAVERERFVRRRSQMRDLSARIRAKVAQSHREPGTSQEQP